MSFRIRDLMISVLPGQDAPKGCKLCTGTTGNQDGQLGCRTCTGTTGQAMGQAMGGCVACTGTTGQVMGQAMGGCVACTGTTGQAMGQAMNGCVTCTGTTHDLQVQAAALVACGICTGVSPALGDQRPHALAMLRQQLQGLLAEVEAEEQRLADAAFPQSAEEAEELERKLEEALAEVRSRKAGLKKG